MEDKLTNQEEQLKALSEDFSLDIDTSELWTNIESQLPPVQTDRRRPLIWWFATGVVVIVMGFLIWINVSFKNEKNIISQQPVQQLEKSKYEIGTKKSIEHTENSSFNDIEKVPFVSTINLDSNSKKTSVLVQKNTVINKIHEHNSARVNYERYDEKPTFWKDEAIDRSPNGEHSLITTLINPSSLSSSRIDFESTENNEVEREILPKISASAIIAKPLIKESDLVLPFLEIKPVKRANWLPYFALSSGLNLHRGKIYSNSNEGLDMLQFQNEEPLAGLSSMLRFGYEKNNGWRFGLGLVHNRIVSRNAQKETIILVNGITGIESAKIDDEGNTISTEGIISETTITNYDLTWHRSHDFINLQLSLGKKLLQKGDFSIYSDATLSNNIWSRHTGYYFSETNILIERFKAAENNPYGKAGFDVGLSLDVEYRINQLSISITPFASMGLNSIMQNTNYYQLKNSQYGVQLGIVYRP